MALRCSRCQTSEMTLESFGVYRCPTCGRVDVDGRLIEEGATVAAPTFAPPPPSSTPAALFVPPASGGAGAPPFFLGMVLLDAILIITLAAVEGHAYRALVSLGFLVPLASGKPFARALALIGAIAEIVMVFLLLLLLRGQLPIAARVLAVLDLALQAVWIYTLFRADTVQFFARAR